MNETDLVQGLRERNPAAIQHLSECWLPSVWRFVYVRVGGDQHLAEDIVSETMLALIKAAGKPEVEINNPGGWLRTVAGNKVSDHYRAAARVQHLIDRSLRNSDTKTSEEPSGPQELEERRAEVRGVMDTLPGQQRIVLEWKYIEKFSVREIAERLSLTEKAVESILFRARRDFKNGINICDNNSDYKNKKASRQHHCESSKDEASNDEDDPECSASALAARDAVEVDGASQ